MPFDSLGFALFRVLIGYRRLIQIGGLKRVYYIPREWVGYRETNKGECMASEPAVGLRTGLH